jgi:hypothetical protein
MGEATTDMVKQESRKKGGKLFTLPHLKKRSRFLQTGNHNELRLVVRVSRTSL